MTRPSRPPPVSTFTPTSAARLHRPSHCAATPASAAAQCAAADQRERAPRSRDRLRHRQPRADARAAGGAAASSDDGQHRDDGEGRGAARRGRENQSACSARRATPASPPPSDAPAHRAAATAAARRNLRLDQLARGGERLRARRESAPARPRRHPSAYPGATRARTRDAGECQAAASASDVPSACSSSAASRCSSSSLALRGHAVTRCRSGS